MSGLNVNGLGAEFAKAVWLRPRGEIAGGKLRDPADRIFKDVSRAEVVRCENRDHDMLRLAFENADIIANEWHEIAGFVRNAEPVTYRGRREL